MQTLRISCVLVMTLLTAPHIVYAQRTVADLPTPKWEEINWMRLKQIVPAVTDRAILPLGTIEAHSVDPNGSDTLIPIMLAELAYADCNALIAPPIYHGASGQSLMDMAGTIRIRPEVLEEYVYDVLKGLARWKIKNVLIINGHGGNAATARQAAQRAYDDFGLRTIVIEWWRFRPELSVEVWGGKLHTPGHGALEETALNIAYNPDLIEEEMYRQIGPEELGYPGPPGASTFPGIASMGLPEEGEGRPNFDVEKANEYARKVAKAMADAFVESIRRWEWIRPSGAK